MMTLTKFRLALFVIKLSSAGPAYSSLFTSIHLVLGIPPPRQFNIQYTMAIQLLLRLLQFLLGVNTSR